MRTLAKEMILAQHVYFHAHEKTNRTLVLGVTQFKMDHHFSKMGYSYAASDGSELPAFRVKAVDRPVEMRLMVRNGEIPEGLEPLLEKYRPLWESRLQLHSKFLGRTFDLQRSPDSPAPQRKRAA